MSTFQPQVSDFASPDQVEALFYEAFAKLDTALMNQVWLGSERAYCIHPGGRPQLGTTRVMESWRRMFQGAEPLVLFYDLRSREMRGDFAVHLVEERLSSRDGRQQGLVMATNCYVRTANGWRLFSHHGSSLPVPAPAKPVSPPHLH